MDWIMLGILTLVLLLVSSCAMIDSVFNCRMKPRERVDQAIFAFCLLGVMVGFGATALCDYVLDHPGEIIPGGGAMVIPYKSYEVIVDIRLWKMSRTLSIIAAAMFLAGLAFKQVLGWVWPMPKDENEIQGSPSEDRG